MPKRKSRVEITVPDATGGMVKVPDRRFEPGPWPIDLQVPTPEADTWLRYFQRECTEAGWNTAGLGQLEAGESSASITVSTVDTPPQQSTVIWERRRDRALRVRAGPVAGSSFPLSQLQQILERATECCKQRVKERFHKQWQLCYEGLPWRGELWLGDSLRLGPPSRQYEVTLFGPRVILVDAELEAIDWRDANGVFQVVLRELTIFLSLVMGVDVRVSANGVRGWAYRLDDNGSLECDVRQLGYYETHWAKDMPPRELIPTIKLRSVQRPDFNRPGTPATQAEEELPDDILYLWNAFSALPPELRHQFRQVATLWQLALSLYQDFRTASFALLVVACEALKPNDKAYRNHEVYEVVEGLLGSERKQILLQPQFMPQVIRNAHLHAGELRGDEFVNQAMVADFWDPSFDDSYGEMWITTRAATVEWLRRGGRFTMPPLKQRRRNWKRWARDKSLLAVPLAAATGYVLGRFLHQPGRNT